MTQKKVQDIDTLIASDDMGAILSMYVDRSRDVQKLRERLLKEPGMSQILSSLLPQPAVAPQSMGPAPWNPLPPQQAPLIPGMGGQYQVPQEGVVDMTGTSQIGEFPMDEYIAGGAESQQAVMNMLGVGPS